MENYFNYHKILKSGYLNCEETDSRQTFILTENLGHFSTEGVTAPLSLVVRKPVGVSDQARHKPGCTATEDV